MATQPLERRPLGRTGEQLSVIGFGGIIVMNESPSDAEDFVAEAVDRGVNYFDVAPSYGNAEERLGPALEPHRDKVFLACKTTQRTAAEARRELENSLRQLRTDHFDLYQLHAITEMQDVETAFGPGGAMEAILQAREKGQVRHVGFSAHSHRAAMLAMDNFDFDTILFPFSFITWNKSGFGPAVHARAKERGMGLLALKAMAHRHWPEGMPREERAWSKTWYEPFDAPDLAALGLRFTLNLPVTAALPPGHWELFRMALEIAEVGLHSTPLGPDEERLLRSLMGEANPIFDEAAAR